MIYFHLTNQDEEILYSDLPEIYYDKFQKCSVKNETFVFNGNKHRHGKMGNEHCSAYLLTNNKDVVERPRLFKEKLKVFLEFVPTIKNIESRIRTKITTHTTDLLHNLRTLNAHNIQELFNLIPESELRQKRKIEKGLLRIK